MYYYKIKKKRKKINKRVIIGIISLFVLSGLIYILFFSSIKIGFLKKKPEANLKQRIEIGIICKGNPAFAEATAGKCFYFDVEGIIFKEAPQTSGSLITLINDFSQRNFNLGEQILGKDLINFMGLIKEELFSKMDLRVLSFDIAAYPADDLKAITNEGWYVMFSLKRDIKSQLSALKAALDEKIQNRTGLQYIDLRIENRVYYK